MAYTRPGPVGEWRQPLLAKELGRIEPKKLGIWLVAGCCLALLTYISFARLFAISVLPAANILIRSITLIISTTVTLAGKGLTRTTYVKRSSGGKAEISTHKSQLEATMYTGRVTLG